jgi:hypothetical protein
MKVRLCIKRSEEPGRRLVYKNEKLTIKEATELFKTINNKNMTKAWLERFDGWHWYLYKRLKGK